MTTLKLTAKDMLHAPEELVQTFWQNAVDFCVKAESEEDLKLAQDNLNIVADALGRYELEDSARKVITTTLEENKNMTQKALRILCRMNNRLLPTAMMA